MKIFNLAKTCTLAQLKLTQNLTAIVLLLAVTSILLFQGCASTNNAMKLPESEENALTDWISSKSTTATSMNLDDTAARPYFASGEQKLWDGEYESALDDYLDLLRHETTPQLQILASYRIYGIAERRFADVREKIERFFNELDWTTLDPIARINLVNIAHRTALRNHAIAKKGTPFFSSNFGNVINWTVSPLLSYYTYEFETPLPGEESFIPKETLSPYDAFDAPNNIGRSRRIYGNAEPSIGDEAHGIYLYESFIKIGGSQPVDLYVKLNSGNRARLTIDNKEVIDIPQDYTLPNAYIGRVKLAPGLHRVLIKTSHVAINTFENFSLVFIPVEGNPLTTLNSGLLTSYANCFGVENQGLCIDVNKPISYANLEVVQKGTPVTKWFDYGFSYMDLTKLPKDVTVADAEQANKEAINTLSDASLLVALKLSQFVYNNDLFYAVWNVFKARHPAFAPGHFLFSKQIALTPFYPADYRQTHELAELRKTTELAPNATHPLLTLYKKTESKTVDRDEKLLKDIVKRAKKIKDPYALTKTYNFLGQYYEQQDWIAEAESYYQKALESDPNNCNAAESLQKIYARRFVYPKPSDLVKEASFCPDLRSYYLNNHDDPDSTTKSIEDAEKFLGRYPWNGYAASELAKAYKKGGRLGDAYHLLSTFLERFPDSISARILYQHLAQIELQGGKYAPQGSTETPGTFVFNKDQAFKDAVETYRKAIELFPKQFASRYLLANLVGEIPLESFIPDGVKLAKEETKDHPLDSNQATSKKSKDAAKPTSASELHNDVYYVHDLIVDKFLPGGGKYTLVYYLIRVMSKEAMDNYAEQSLPYGAIPIIVRTIKQDGTTQTPEANIGKSTYSMTGLAEGDYIEVAYLNGNSNSIEPSDFKSSKIFFQMTGIGTRHSEYIILGLDKLKTSDNSNGYKIEIRNNGPQGIEKTLHGEKALVFLQTDNSGHRREPSSDQLETYVPWVMLSGTGSFERDLKRRKKIFSDALKISSQLTPDLIRLFDKWNQEALKSGFKMGTKDWLETLYLDATGLITDKAIEPAATSVYTHRGDPTYIFIALLRYFNVPFEVYGVKSSFSPEKPPIAEELSVYNSQLFKLQSSDAGPIWTDIGDRFSSFNSVSETLIDRLAICYTCDSNQVTKTPSEEAFRSNTTEFKLDGSLSADGTLKGTLTLTFDGSNSGQYREVASSITNERLQERVGDSVINQIISGSTVVKSNFSDTQDRRKPISFTVQFETPEFARKTEDGLLIDRPFLANDASNYVSLDSRTTPMLAPQITMERGSVTLQLPAKATASIIGATNKSGSFKGDYFKRNIKLEGDKLIIDVDTKTKLHHLQPADYPEFKTFVLNLKHSAQLNLSIKTQ